MSELRRATPPSQPGGGRCPTAHLPDDVAIERARGDYSPPAARRFTDARTDPELPLELVGIGRAGQYTVAPMVLDPVTAQSVRMLLSVSNAIRPGEPE
jgi:hypothetical protein